ncbi:MAG: DUF63 family protein [Methanoregulaceae archaeon]|nr:DUF63 family protein [Methanoregulaceae archaeon]
MIREFLYKYYIDPIRYGQPYNPVDTLTYAIILIIAVYLVYRWLQRTGISVDRRFVLATLPFVVLGGISRVIQDTGMIHSDLQFLLVTPLIYFVIFFYTAGSLVISRVAEKRGLIKDYARGYAAAGVFACIVVAGVLLAFGLDRGSVHPEVMAIILSLAGLTTLAVYAVLYYGARWRYVRDPVYLALISGHMLDASATSYGIDLHPLVYVEQHVVGSQLIEWTGTAFAFFPLKLLVIVPGIYILEQYRSEGNQALWHLILLAMIVVGMAPGIRDMVRMILYV